MDKTLDVLRSVQEITRTILHIFPKLDQHITHLTTLLAHEITEGKDLEQLRNSVLESLKTIIRAEQREETDLETLRQGRNPTADVQTLISTVERQIVTLEELQEEVRLSEKDPALHEPIRLLMARYKILLQQEKEALDRASDMTAA